MQPNVLLDYEFVVSADAYAVRALLKLEGRAPEDASRVPLNLSLVLDRSGSMGGAKLAAACDAAAHLAERLHPEDLLSVVSYDDVVDTVSEPSTAAGAAGLPARIRAIRSGGSTNLSGGWMRGRELVARNQRDNASNRVVLMTDGLANVGITDPERLVGLCVEARRQGVTTTTIGFGADYDEHLLRAMADGGGGHSYYIERPDQAPGVFAEELEGLLTLAAQNVMVEIRPTPAARLTCVHHSFPRSDLADGCRLDLGDLHAREPKMLLLEFHVPDQTSTEPVRIAELRIHAHVLTAGGGVERQEVILALSTPLSRSGHVEPEIRRELLLQDAARSRERALEARRRGDFQGGMRVLEESVAALRERGDLSDAMLREEMVELKDMAARFAASRVSAQDAKYMFQKAHDLKRAKLLAMQKYARAYDDAAGAEGGAPIRYVQGDATQPDGPGLRMIAHLCTDTGEWERRGFALSLARRWPEAERQYLAWTHGALPVATVFRAGAVQVVPVDPQVLVAHMIAKVAAPSENGARVVVDYAALESALGQLGEEALQIGASVHMPRIGCGAARGRWHRIEPLIDRYLSSRGIPVTVYDLVGGGEDRSSRAPGLRTVRISRSRR